MEPYSYKPLLLQVDHPVQMPGRIQIHGTVKHGCPATVEIKEAVDFTNIHFDTSDPMEAFAVLGRLRSAIAKNEVEGLETEKRFYVRLPRRFCHQGHVLGPVIFFLAFMTHLHSGTKIGTFVCQYHCPQEKENAMYPSLHDVTFLFSLSFTSTMAHTTGCIQH